MNKHHKHEWVLINKWDSKAKSFNEKHPLPKGQWVSRGGWRGGATYIPGFDREMLQAHIIDSINESGLPRCTSETWACHCGKTKTHSHTYPSPFSRLTKGNNLPTEDFTPSRASGD